MPTKKKLVMTSFITLGHVDTITDPTVELIKKELAGETSIRRAVRQGQPNVEALHDQPTFGDVAGGVVDDSGSHPAVAGAVSRDYEHVGAQEKINTFENTFCTGPSHPYAGQSHLQENSSVNHQESFF